MLVRSLACLPYLCEPHHTLNDEDFVFQTKSKQFCRAKCFLNGPKLASFCLFSFFSHDKYSTNLTTNDKSRDGVVGIQTWGGRMVGADESTELWRHPPPNRAKCFDFKTLVHFQLYLLVQCDQMGLYFERSCQ